MTTCPYCRQLLTYSWGLGNICQNYMCSKPVQMVTRTTNTANK